jgi:uncharacterized membrane protein
MTNNTPQHDGGDAQTTSAYNVIAVSFDPDTNAYAALTALKELDAQQRVGLQAATVVVRGEDGEINVKDQVGTDEFAGTAGGGLIGVLVGILGGPLGVLLGGSYGLLVGSLVDLGEVEQSESVLSQISASVKPGHTALLAEVNEQSPEVVDTAVAELGGTVLRRPVGEVEAEIAGAARSAAQGHQGAPRRQARAQQAGGSHQGRAAQGEAVSRRADGERIARTPSRRHRLRRHGLVLRSLGRGGGRRSSSRSSP